MTREEEIKQADYISTTPEEREVWVSAAKWADEHPKKIPTLLNDIFNQMTFDVNTPQFLKEACENCYGGMYVICWNIFRLLLLQVAQRATELHDPILDVLMIKLNLYELKPSERRVIIEQIQKEWED